MDTKIRPGVVTSGHDYDPTGSACKSAARLLMTIGVNLQRKQKLPAVYMGGTVIVINS